MENYIRFLAGIFLYTSADFNYLKMNFLKRLFSLFISLNGAWIVLVTPREEVFSDRDLERKLSFLAEALK